MSSAQWYYRVGNVECGPVATDELLFLKQSGSVTATTSVREEGTTQWVLLRETGLLRTSGKRTVKPDAQSSPPAQFLQAQRYREDVKTSQNSEQTPIARQPAPLPPIVSQDKSDRNHQILIGSLAGLLVLMVLMWVLWPKPEIATGMASSGTGDGAADAGAEQSANEDTSSKTGETTSTSASASGTDLSDVGAAESAEANNDGPTPTEAAGENSSGTGAGDAVANNQGAGEMSDDDKPSGVESDSSATAATGLAVGDDDGSRFSVSAPGETTFFGLRGTGRRFSYVVDCSGSMQGAPLARAIEELIASIKKLPSYVEFQIVFFDDLAYEFPDSGFRNASKKTKEEAARFINSISGGGGTNVKLGMQTTLSLKQKADTVFLLTDGAFDTDTPAFIKNLNKDKKVRVNTVAFLSNAGESLLKKIASENRGDYRFVQ